MAAVEVDGDEFMVESDGLYTEYDVPLTVTIGPDAAPGERQLRLTVAARDRTGPTPLPWTTHR